LRIRQIADYSGRGLYSQLADSATNSSCKHIENNLRFEGFCGLCCSSKPTYLRFHIQLLVLFQNTHRSKELLIAAESASCPVNFLPL